MKFRERLQYFLGLIPLAMLASLLLTYALSGLAPAPVTGEKGFSDPYVLSGIMPSSETVLRIAGSGSRIIATGASVGADGDRQPLPEIAALFGITASPWSGRYVRAEETETPGEAETQGLAGAMPGLAAALSRRPEGATGLPCLVFQKNDGSSVILEPVRDFDGKTPLVSLHGTTASLNGPFALNTPAPDRGTGETARGIGRIELNLTDEGRARLTAAGIPTTLYAAIERVTPRTSALLLNADLAEAARFQKIALDPVNEWYRSKFALYFPGSREEAYWRMYAPLFRAETAAAKEKKGLRDQSVPEQAANPAVAYRFKVDSVRMWRQTGEGPWEPFTIKGVNLGSALPGKAFTEFSRDEALYWHWFSLMRDMRLNAIRVYTLFPPEFYRSLAAFNRANPGGELFLLQEIWPDEAAPGRNLLDTAYSEAFYREIEYAVSAVHGAATVPERTGRAFGVYDADASPWVAAFLVGREIESDEVLDTDALNTGHVYSGRWFSVPKGSPTEAWLAEACDRVASLEADRWGQARPVSVVSWPPLDPLPHWVEWRDPLLDGRALANDKAEVVIDHIEVSPDFAGGFFSSWHIYPNYPDFMIATPWYSKYRDEEGEFRYGGYLKELRAFSPRYPLLLAEFGLSTSWGTAHIAPDGLDHGGISEDRQGPALVRMAKAALREGYMGAVIFEWADEWAKQTWTTAPFMIPFSGHQAWHNALDPEQYYGIIAMDAGPPRPTPEGEAVETEGAFASRLGTAGNEEFLTLTLTREGGWQTVRGTLTVGFDVRDPESGITALSRAAEPEPISGEIRRGFEFLLEIPLPLDGSRVSAGTLLAADTCNVGKNRFAMTGAKASAYEEVRITVNRETVDSLGRRSGVGETDRSRIAAGNRGISVEGDTLTARVPWTMLNVADPSRALVIDDPRFFGAWPPPDSLQTAECGAITLQGMFIGSVGGAEVRELFPRKGGTLADSWRYAFRKWTEPRWQARKKPAVGELAAFFGAH